MAVEEKVVIKVDVDFTGGPELARAKAQLAALGRETDKISKASARLRSTAKDWDRLTTKIQALGVIAGKTSKMFVNFFTAMSKLATKGLALEIAAVSIAILSAKVAMMTGRATNRLYQQSLQGVALAAGAAAVAIGTLAGAAREFAQVNLIPAMGGLRQSMAAFRSVAVDPRLSIFGMETLPGLVGSLGRSGMGQANINPVLRALGDITGGDSKQMQQMARAVAAAQRKGTVGQETISAFEQLGPQFKGVTKGMSGMSSDKFISGLIGGQFTPEVFKGQLERMNSTLMGTVKGLITRLTHEFAEFGQVFVQPMRDALLQIERLTRRWLVQTRVVLREFGLNELIPGMVESFDNMASKMARLINTELPKLTEVGKNFRDFFSAIGDWFRDIGAALRPLEEGANVLINVLTPAWDELFGGTGLIGNFNDMLIRNRDAWMDLGDAFGFVVRGIMQIFDEGNRIVVANLPVLTSFFNVVANDVMPAIKSMLSLFKDAFFELLPTMGSGLTAIASGVTAVSGALSGLLKTPGLGTLLAVAVMGGMRSRAMFSPLHAMAMGGRGGILRGGSAYQPLPPGVAGPVLPGGRKGMLGGGLRTIRQNWAQGAAGSTGGMMGRLRGGWLGATGAKGSQLGKGMGYAGRGVMGMGLAALGPALGLDAGAAQMGGMLAMFNPALGGAVAGLGTAMKARTGAGGAMAGAAGGASLGMLAFPLLGPIAPILGAGLGAIIGNFFGNRNKEKFKKKAHEVADTIGEGLFDRMKTSGTSAIETLQKEAKDLLKDEDALRKMAKDRGADYDELVISLQNVNDEVEILANERLANLSHNFDRLALATGYTREELERMADRVGVLGKTGEGVVSMLELMNLLDLNRVPTTKAEWRGLTEGGFYDQMTSNTELGKRIIRDNFADQTKAAYDRVLSEQNEFGQASDQAVMDLATATFAEGQNMNWLGMGPAAFMETVLGNADMTGISGRTLSEFTRLARELPREMDVALEKMPEYQALEARLRAIAGSGPHGETLLQTTYGIDPSVTGESLITQLLGDAKGGTGAFEGVDIATALTMLSETVMSETVASLMTLGESSDLVSAQLMDLFFAGMSIEGALAYMTGNNMDPNQRSALDPTWKGGTGNALAPSDIEAIVDIVKESWTSSEYNKTFRTTSPETGGGTAVGYGVAYAAALYELGYGGISMFEGNVRELAAGGEAEGGMAWTEVGMMKTEQGVSIEILDGVHVQLAGMPEYKDEIQIIQWVSDAIAAALEEDGIIADSIRDATGG